MDQCVVSPVGLQWVCELGVFREASSIGEARQLYFCGTRFSSGLYLQSVLLIYIAVTLIKVRDTFNRDSNCSTVTYRLQQQPTIDMLMWLEPSD